MSTDLSGTRALITGATSGLGRAMAEALLAAGARVAITSRSAERAEAAAATLGGGDRALGVGMDVRDEAAVTAGVDVVYGAFGAVDLLVLNAGIGMRTVNPRFMTDPQPFWRVTPAGFRDVAQTKIDGTFLVARDVVPRMLSDRAGAGGRIVVVSMNQQTMTRRGFVPYGPSGAGVEALARVMIADLADSAIRVNILLPGGATLTGMIPEDVGDEARERLLDPSVMGPPIVWLASPGAADAHGERIVATAFGDQAV